MGTGELPAGLDEPGALGRLGEFEVPARVDGLELFKGLREMCSQDPLSIEPDSLLCPGDRPRDCGRER